MSDIDYDDNKLDENKLNENTLNEHTIKETKIKKIMLPWCGCILENNCECLKVSSGLYTQCNNVKSTETVYCNKCIILNDKNGGTPVYGSVNDRIKCGILDYIDPTGKKPVPYVNIMKKLNLTREEVESRARELEWCVPECHFEEPEKKTRGRPKKESSEKKEKTGKERRGRPKKDRNNIVNGDQKLDTMIESLIKSSRVDVDVVLCESDSELDCEETVVIRYEVLGKWYLKCENDYVYDICSHDLLGRLDVKRGVIEYDVTV